MGKIKIYIFQIQDTLKSGFYNFGCGFVKLGCKLKWEFSKFKIHWKALVIIWGGSASVDLQGSGGRMGVEVEAWTCEIKVQKT